MRRTSAHRRPSGVGLAGLLLALAPAAAFSQQSTEQVPAAQVFRTLQLAILSCSRENTAPACEQARRQADPLLDHPRLQASCKDVLWAITQKARPAAGNSSERRDRLDRLASDLVIICRPPAPRPSKKS